MAATAAHLAAKEARSAARAERDERETNMKELLIKPESREPSAKRWLTWFWRIDAWLLQRDIRLAGRDCEDLAGRAATHDGPAVWRLLRARTLIKEAEEMIRQNNKPKTGT